MMPTKGYIFIDLDGTLIDKNYRILKKDVDGIKRALDFNYKVVFISGRPLKFVMWIRDQVDHRIHTIGFNGAQIENQDPIVLNKTSVDALMQYTDQVVFKSEQGYYTTAKTIPSVFQYDMLANYPQLSESSFDKSSVVKVLIFTDAKEYDHVYKNIKEVQNISISAYEPKGFEIAYAGVDKGNAIKRYVDVNTKVYSIGDDVNDISMFEVSDQYYVMNTRFGGIYVSNVYEAIHMILEEGGN